jgi:putative ABC transport system substrate-binding protein
VPNGSLIIEATGFVGDNHRLFLGLAKKYRLPAIYPNRNYVADGGLMSYSSNQDEWVRRPSSHQSIAVDGGRSTPPRYHSCPVVSGGVGGAES